MLSRCCEKLSELDLFAAPVPGLNIKKRSRLYTWFGLLLSTVAIGFILAYFGYLCHKLASRNDPSFYSWEEPNATTNDRIYVFNAKFQMGFALIDSNSRVPFRDNTIYTMKPILHFVSNINGNTFTQDVILETEPCTAAHFSNAFDGYEGLWCINDDSEIGKVFVTDWSGAWLEIQFARCLAPATCADEDVIQTTLSQSEWETYYPEYLINPISYDTPLKREYLQTLRPVVLSQRHQTIMTIKRIDFLSDNGIFISNTKNESVLTLKGIDDNDAAAISDGVFLAVTLVNSGIVLHFNRNYDKVPDILANVFGLMELIIIIIGLIILPLIGIKTYEHVINSVFDVRKRKPRRPERRGKGKNSLGKGQKRKGYTSPVIIGGAAVDATGKNERQNPSDSQREKYNNEQDEIKKRDIQPERIVLDIDDHHTNEKGSSSKSSQREEEQGYRQGLDPFDDPEAFSENGKIKVTHFKWLKSKFVGDPDMEMYDKGKDMIQNNIDIITLLKKALEIDKLKACLLTRDQRILFDNLPKPVLYEDMDLKKYRKNSIKSGHLFPNYEGRKKELKEVYYRLKETEDRSQLDNRLLDLFEDKDDYL